MDSWLQVRRLNVIVLGLYALASLVLAVLSWQGWESPGGLLPVWLGLGVGLSFVLTARTHT